MQSPRVVVAAGAMIAFTLVAPVKAYAQGETPCVATLEHADNGRQQDIGGGRIRQFAWGNVRASCDGQETSMRADSIAWLEDLDRFDMVGRVRFRDTTVTLDADRARYFLQDERLEAYGNVRLVNLANGTILTGPNLTYWRSVPSLRDTTELYADGRPTVEYRAVGDTAEAEPYVIVGDHIRLKADEIAWAGGDVHIDRSDFHSQGDSAELDLAANGGRLIGQAQVNGRGNGAGEDSTGFQMKGLEIAFTSVDNELNWVQARDSAEAQSQDFWINADTVEFAIEDERVQGGLAWGDSIRPYAISENNRITADSLAIDSPDQQLEELRGFGAARAQSIRGPLDAEGDWIAGDTLIAQFGEVESGERRMIQELTAIGRALALYRIYPEEGIGPPDFNYSRGDHITATFGEDGLRQVDVVGNADGLHLESLERRRRR